MDAAPDPAHPRPTRRCGRDAADRASVPRRATWISRLAPMRLKSAPTRADSAPTHADSRRTRRIRADSGRIGSYRQNIGVFRPKKGNQPVRGKEKKKNFWTGLDGLKSYLCFFVLLCFVFLSTELSSFFFFFLEVFCNFFL